MNKQPGGNELTFGLAASVDNEKEVAYVETALDVLSGKNAPSVVRAFKRDSTATHGDVLTPIAESVEPSKIASSVACFAFVAMIMSVALFFFSSMKIIGFVLGLACVGTLCYALWIRFSLKSFLDSAILFMQYKTQPMCTNEEYWTRPISYALNRLPFPVQFVIPKCSTKSGKGGESLEVETVVRLWLSWKNQERTNEFIAESTRAMVGAAESPKEVISGLFQTAVSSVRSVAQEVVKELVQRKAWSDLEEISSAELALITSEIIEQISGRLVESGHGKLFSCLSIDEIQKRSKGSKKDQLPALVFIPPAAIREQQAENRRKKEDLAKLAVEFDARIKRLTEEDIRDTGYELLKGIRSDIQEAPEVPSILASPGATEKVDMLTLLERKEQLLWKAVVSSDVRSLESCRMFKRQVGVSGAPEHIREYVLGEVRNIEIQFLIADFNYEIEDLNDVSGESELRARIRAAKLPQDEEEKVLAALDEKARELEGIHEHKNDGSVQREKDIVANQIRAAIEMADDPDGLIGDFIAIAMEKPEKMAAILHFMSGGNKDSAASDHLSNELLRIVFSNRTILQKLDQVHELSPDNGHAQLPAKTTEETPLEKPEIKKV
jgi:hypothetical protein